MSHVQNLILMHKNVPVLEFQYDEEISAIINVGEVTNSNHIPPRINYNNNIVNKRDINDWWKDRALPISRAGLKNALQELGIQSRMSLLEKNYGLSLTDCYWVRPENQNIKWEDINFFKNEFSSHVGSALFGETFDAKSINLRSPECSADGWLPKKWEFKNGEHYLIKKGSGPYKQEPLNEVFASKLMQSQNIPHVSYKLIKNKDELYSVCKSFTSESKELIPAYELLKTLKKSNNHSLYQHFLRCAENVGLKSQETKEFLDKMIVVDYLIANTDRHYANFGVLRNPDTLQYIGFAPIFDNGTSLWCNTQENAIKPIETVPSETFAKSHSKNIKLVNSFEWINFNNLTKMPQVLTENFLKCGTMSRERCEILGNAVKNNIQSLEHFVAEKKQTNECQEKPVYISDDDISL